MNRTRALSLCSLVLLVVVMASGCLVVGEPTTIIDAGRAYDVNNHGVVVGSRWLAGPPVSVDDHAYRHDLATGTTTDLGTLGGVAAAANAVNDDGMIVGWSQLANGQRRAFVHEDGSGMTDLGTLQPAATVPTSIALDVNVGGVVVGWSNLETGAEDAARAFVYDPASATMTSIGTLGGTSSAATAINDAGVVVGWSDVAGDTAHHAFAYDPATATMTDLGTLGGDSEATDLNEHGQVVGWSELDEQADPICGGACPLTRGFVYDLGTGSLVEIGLPVGFTNAYPSGINEDGIVVGSTVRWEISCSHCPLPTRAAAWELGTTGTYKLADDQRNAEAINDAGLTVGTGFTNEPFAPIPFAFHSQVTIAPDE